MKQRTRGIQRRHLLALGAGWLAGCGGGGGGTGGGGPPAAGAPSGTLVFTDGSQVAAWKLAAGSGVEFDAGDIDDIGHGVTPGPGGTVAVMLEGDNQSFSFATFDPAGRRTGLFEIRRKLAFQTSVLAFDAPGTRVAFSLNEIASASDDTRVDRTLVAQWPGGNLLAVLEGWEEPVWAGPAGELIVRDPATCRLRLFSAALQDQGWLANLVVQPNVGSFSVSPDGRYIVMEDAGRIQAWDRQIGSGWVAAERLSDLHCPCFSPDGRWLAMHAIDLATAIPTYRTYVPHLVPFVPGTTVQVDESIRRVDDSLVFSSGRMAWLP